MAFKASNTEEFIIKAKKVHGDKYDYSQVTYVKNSLKVNIICKEHGVFMQTPQCHIKGSGCPICARHIKYTKVVCQNEANKYSTREEFRKNSPKIYDVACKKHWLDEICINMKGKAKYKAGWWNNIDHCIETASLYKSPHELKKAESGCYVSIINHKWQEICYKHMNSWKREYTEQQLIELARICKTHKEFRTKYSGAYSAAKNKNLLGKICLHMPPLRKNIRSSIPLTFENCKRIANDFESRSDFQKFENGRWYQYARRNNILDEICEHMPLKGNKRKRCIYAAEFNDNSVYVGLTYFTKRRWSDHLRDENSAVNIYIKEKNIEPKWKQLTDYMDYQEASIQEGVWKGIYAKEGWTILNRAKTGALGGYQGYTKEEVLNIAKKFSSLKDFRLNAPGYYQSGYRSDYWEEIKEICKPLQRIKYSEEELKEIASDYTDITDFYNERHGAYEAIKRLGKIKEYCGHMTNERHQHRWTNDEIMKVARLCHTKKEFREKYPKQYSYAYRTKRMNFFCFHMQPKISLPSKWTDEAIIKEALKYKTRSEFEKGCVAAYQAAHKSGKFDELCPHLPKPTIKDYICNSIEDAFSLAAECSNRTELKEQYNKAYEILRTKGLLDDACSHMKKYKKPIEKWTKEERAKAAASCKTRKEFHDKFQWAHYLASQNEGELDAICSHMPKPNRWTDELLIELASQCSNMKELKELNFKAYIHVTHTKGKSSFVRRYFKKQIAD